MIYMFNCRLNIIFDEEIYPRVGIDHRRVAMFTEILRDGHQFDSIEVQIHPEDNAVYRLLDGAHRYNAHKEIGGRFGTGSENPKMEGTLNDNTDAD